MPGRVAVLGIGLMGEGMARNLLRGGCAVTVWNRTAGKTAALVHEGAAPAGSPAEAARYAEFVVTMVSDPPALDAVASGPSGLFEGIRSGAVWVNMGTQRVSQILSLAAETARRGASFLDAPVTGSRSGAAEGTLTILAGGSPEVLDRCRPVLEKMGRTVLHVGEVGDGTRAKLVLNLIQSGMLAAWSEGLSLGCRMGLPPATLLRMLENSAGNSGLFRYKGPFLLRRDFSTNFALALMRKDVRLALDEARAAGADLPVAEVVASLFEEAMAAGFGGEDFLALARVIEARAGTRIEE
jgi:3-hydroxyisobutyrate dehydrogenase-like beta-hydroxyacid dehydrogenase